MRVSGLDVIARRRATPDVLDVIARRQGPWTCSRDDDPVHGFMDYVLALRRHYKDACIKFRNLLLTECNVDPFLEAVTIASACNLAFRRNFLKPNTIGLIPKQGYRMGDTQSSIALQWLVYEEMQRNVRIQHAGRERETVIDGYKVDGFDGERIYEFHGCYFHGCKKCFPFKRDERLQDDPSDTLNNRYQKTKEKMDRLANTLYEVIEMWECDFLVLKKQENLSYLENHPVLNNVPLIPRDAFYGGRTGNTKTYHECESGEEIKYVDVCSLYPYVCKYGKYPVGHPTVYVGDAECRGRGLSVEGLLKCKILPPVDLYHPVLPSRMHGKLMFVLCRKCGEETNQDTCHHSDDERALVGTWVMDEIRVAVENGYNILQYYELWEYGVATFEKGGLFTEFINKFLKMKQEASGYPEWCQTDEDKNRYIRQYLDHEGISLDPLKIEKNGGLRSLAKLMLNSFWGKFGERENQTKATIVRDPETLFNMLINPAVQVNTIQEINQDTLLVNWQNIEEVGGSLRRVNVAIAAYTTAQARLKLYEHLKALGAQVIYYDTDSVVYLLSDNLHKVPTGDYLGEMTDELTDYGPGSFIIAFVSGGPKTSVAKMSRKNKDLVSKIAELEEAVRHKFRRFKDGNVENERLLEQQYRPIIRELKKTEPQIKAEQMSAVKGEEEEEGEEAMDYVNKFGRYEKKEKALVGPKGEGFALTQDGNYDMQDEACKVHDIAYSRYKDNAHRQQADKELAERAWRRFKSSDASVGEKAAAWAVTTAMKTKAKFGGGKRKKKQSTRRVKKKTPGGRGLYLRPYPRGGGVKRKKRNTRKKKRGSR
ncbi:uncharacterized protein LOC128982090 [Macrosteles quadrilineatus]|uniref:uncharacterized protein LOC128982090 n=1 Tax=Macrosteles quadrilineatus TaxID=74068 RepID=UPI0023E1A59B|nr:uncharacterized protein LOC128982090 [Macrosteles quadrilineatus]